MWDQYLYVSEKLRELERGGRDRLPQPPSQPKRPRRPQRRVFGPVVRAAGRRVRRAGEALESWGGPRPATRA
jgi:hypothetical protein